MFARGLTQREIGNRLGMGQSVVSRTIFGSANNRRVLALLRDEGCPVHALALPEDMKKTAKQDKTETA
jgi:transcriptional regulator with XRE-family HTH domain